MPIHSAAAARASVPPAHALARFPPAEELLVQGFAVAGEISGASSMILEHAPFGRRGFYASFTLQGVQAGQIMAAAVFLPLAAYMPAEAFNTWGWRISIAADRRVRNSARLRRNWPAAGMVKCGGGPAAGASVTGTGLPAASHW